jgi:hypothetical protein
MFIALALGARVIRQWDGVYIGGLKQVDLLKLNNSDMNKDPGILSHLLGTLGWIFQGEQQALNHSRLRVPKHWTS